MNQLEEEVRLAGKAREVLDSDAFRASVDQVEKALLGAMKSAAIVDDKLRLRLLDKYECLHALLNCLESMVDTGLMAEEQLRQKSLGEKVKDFLHL